MIEKTELNFLKNEYCPHDFQEWMIWFRDRYKVLQAAQ